MEQQEIKEKVKRVYKYSPEYVKEKNKAYYEKYKDKINKKALVKRIEKGQRTQYKGLVDDEEYLQKMNENKKKKEEEKENKIKEILSKPKKYISVKIIK